MFEEIAIGVGTGIVITLITWLSTRKSALDHAADIEAQYVKSKLKRDSLAGLLQVVNGNNQEKPAKP